MKSSVVKRSMLVATHRTSISLEIAVWEMFKQIAHHRRTTISELAGAIELERRHGNLSSAVRLFVLDYYRDLVSEYENRDRTRDMLAATALQHVATRRH